MIDAARGYPEASAFLGEQHQTFRIQISIISAMELAVGSRNSTELSETKRFLESVRIIPVDTNVSNAAYKLIETFTLSHGLAIPDALIAATATRNGLTLSDQEHAALSNDSWPAGDSPLLKLCLLLNHLQFH